MIDRPRPPARVAAGTFAIIFLGSYLSPLHFDEVFWLETARLVSDYGRTLYVSAIDNKTPIVYLAAYLIDLLPGSFELVRAIVVGGLAAGVVRSAGILTGGLRAGRMLSLVLALAISSRLVFTIEFAAVSCLVAGVVQARRGRSGLAVFLSVLAVAFDPRAVLIAPLTLMWGLDDAERVERIRALSFALGLVALGILVVALVPDLRYGLVELNLASRARLGGPDLLGSVTTLLTVALPLAAAVWRPVRPDRLAVGLTLSAAAIALISLNPFPHYATYLVLAFLYWVERTPPPAGIPLPWIVGAAVPGLIAVAVAATVQARTLDQYEAASEYVASELGPEGTLIHFGYVPYPSFYSGLEVSLDSPGIHYLTWRTSRRSVQLEELDSQIEHADAMMFPAGALDSDRLFEPLQPIWSSFESRLSEFSCVKEISGLEIRFRTETCDR